MSAETLRRAVAELRAQWADDDGPRPMGTAWHQERDFHLAAADWLEQMATCWHLYEDHAIRNTALVAARTYLGESS